MSAKSSASQRQIEANRINALKSTGPRTPEGRAASSRNAVRHGAFVAASRLVGSDKISSDALLKTFIHDLAPRDTVECLAVERVAELTWKSRRLSEIEDELLNDRAGAFAQEFADQSKYFIPTWTSPEAASQFYRAREGATDPTTGAALHQTLLLENGRDRKCAETLERLSKLQMRLDTQLQRAWKHLRLLQNAKRNISEAQEEQQNPNEQIRMTNEEEAVSTDAAGSATIPAQIAAGRNEANSNASVVDTTSSPTPPSPATEFGGIWCEKETTFLAKLPKERENTLRLVVPNGAGQERHLL